VTAALLLLACWSSSPTEPAPAQEAPAPAEPVEGADEADAPQPGPIGPVRVLHHRMSKGRRTPKHVSATWVADGLQVMITGFTGSCEPPPEFSVVKAGAVLRLVEVEPDAQARCPGTHTMMLQIDGLAAQDLTVEVVSDQGKTFGETELASTDH